MRSHPHAVAPAAKPQFAFEAGGRLNVDTLAAEGLKAHLAVDLGQREAAYLPPQLQLMPKIYELEGMLAVDATVDGPLTDPMTTAVRLDVRLRRSRPPLRRYPISGAPWTSW